MKSLIPILAILVSLYTTAQKVPSVYSNINFNNDGELVFFHGDSSYIGIVYEPLFSIEDFTNNVYGTANGIGFEFKNNSFQGKMYFGLIHYNDSKHPIPVFRKYIPIENGKVQIDIKNQLGGRYDMTGWEKSGQGVMGYRIQDAQGNMIYEGRVAFKGNGPFTIGNVISQGPFVDQITDNSAIISLTTVLPTKVEINVNDRIYKSRSSSTNHEIKIDKLTSESYYNYSINLDGTQHNYGFKTAPKQGSRTSFTFAYASDSRGGTGGGERNMHGANYYIIRKIMALAHQQDAVFMQFSGDLINGYLSNEKETNLQYANWKRAIEPWAHYMPVYEGMGNHEALTYIFPITGGTSKVSVDKFPFESHSAEAIFNKNFVNPLNGPQSEDGASYDPDKKNIDFPTYKENVYHYNYDNIAVICLNSDYFFAPSLKTVPQTSGNLHGYILDNQLAWLEKVLNEYENNTAIDHVFITQHTPAFPNGGHVHDDMWYNGNNQYRPWIAGKALPKGIIERRDQFLDLLINKSTKVIAMLTGDEHNYCRTTINPDMPIYPESGYYAEKVKLSRTIYQINNGAAGAPYYAQQQTPWTNFVEGFTTQNALVLIHVEGKSVELQVLNPDTLEEIDKLILRN